MLHRTQSQAQFGSYVEAGTLLNNYAHVLDLLTRLRQAINHPYLVIYSKREAAQAEAGSASQASGGAQGAICGLCYEDGEDVVLTGCGHPFCRACMREYIDALAADAVSSCPTCEQPLSVDLHAASITSLAASAAYTVGGAASNAADPLLAGGAVVGGVAAAGHAKAGLLARVDLRNFQSSTKIEVTPPPSPSARSPALAGSPSLPPLSRSLPLFPLSLPRPFLPAPPRSLHLSLASEPRSTRPIPPPSSIPQALMEELHTMREDDPSAKAIVFSQFVSFLDIVEYRLLRAGIKVVKLNGGMTAAAREVGRRAFTTQHRRVPPSTAECR